MSISNSWLAHYASKYYDPVKAHEYYMRTRELKGNTRKTSELNDEGKEIWKVSKDSIKTEKKKTLESEKTKNAQATAQHRAKAQQTRESITAKLKSLNERLSSSLSSDVKRIQNSSSLTKGQKTAKIAELRANAKGERAKNSADASSQRAEVANDLKNVLLATREAYAKAKTSINESYEKIFQSEFDKIKAQYPTKGSKKKKNKS